MKNLCRCEEAGTVPQLLFNQRPRHVEWLHQKAIKLVVSFNRFNVKGKYKQS